MRHRGNGKSSSAQKLIGKQMCQPWLLQARHLRPGWRQSRLQPEKLQQKILPLAGAADISRNMTLAADL